MPIFLFAQTTIFTRLPFLNHEKVLAWQTKMKKKSSTVLFISALALGDTLL
jgi:hypothetical protein